MLWYLPETSHPGTRGLDKLKPTDRKWVWMNPFASLGILRSPNLALVVSPIDSYTSCIFNCIQTVVATTSLIGIVGEFDFLG